MASKQILLDCGETIILKLECVAILTSRGVHETNPKLIINHNACLGGVLIFGLLFDQAKSNKSCMH
jgi:hypothetical protein